MKIASYTFIIVLVTQAFFVSTLINDDANVFGKLLTLVVNSSKFLRRFIPRYPSANRDAPLNTVETYDFIIVGASPSGAVVANRLSENPKWRVLLLEAGEEPSRVTDIPVLCGSISFSKFNWGYRTEKQEGFCRGCYQGNLIYPHGKVLGGTSILNYMIYVRGNKNDYEKWESQGNPGWSYQDVLPYFLKSEDAHIKIKDEEYHQNGGYLNISDVPFRSGAAEAWVDACQQAGYQYVDYNGRNQHGVSYVQSTTGYGERWSAERAFLRPIRKRPNLTIRTNALVTRVLIHDKNKNAYGVEYFKNGTLRKVKARKEVIVSAGSLNSPQILMLSGIGPAEHLYELGISIIRDLPVGKTMYDHACFPALMFKLNENIVLDQLEYITNPKYLHEYVTNHTGPFGSIGGVEALTYIKTNVSTDPAPDIELIFVGGSLNTDFGFVFRRIFNVPQAIYDKVWKPLEKQYVVSIIPMLLHPKSKGHIKLRSKSPFDAPKFYVNFLSDSENHDVKTFIASIREVQRIMKTPAYQKFDARIVDTPLPGCETMKFDSDAYWECALRTIIGSLWHQVGTCKMGPRNDRDAVVDNKFRVHGINKLRVIDTGVIPVTLSAHTVGPAYMIGEKGAVFIKDTWKSQ